MARGRRSRAGRKGRERVLIDGVQYVGPDIVEAIAAGRQPSDLTAHRLIRAVDLPIAWSAQKQLLGFPAASR
jgi:site-specific DNA recombinase